VLAAYGAREKLSLLLSTMVVEMGKMARNSGNVTHWHWMGFKD